MPMILSLIFCFAPLSFALSNDDVATLDELTKTLEARVVETDGREDAAAVVVERSLASEVSEPVPR